MKIALFHPNIEGKGGAERVVLEILKNSKHDIDLYTYTYNPNKTLKEFKKFQHKIFVIGPKFLKKLFEFKGYISRLALFILPFFSKIPLENYDAFLVSTAGYAEFILFTNYKKGKTFAYVHTPLKGASEKIVEWELKYRLKGLNKFYLFIKVYRFFERIAWKKINIAIFNSELTLGRAKERNLLKGKKVYVVYPTVFDLKIENKIGKPEDYFLYVSRFAIYKRQNVLIKAWEKFVKKYPQYKLILAGYPTEGYEELIDLAKKVKNVEIRANPSEEEVRDLYSHALACFFVGFEEDFGIVPFEVLATGKTLIAVDKGGYVNLVKRAPVIIWIKDSLDNEVLARRIYKALEKFIERKDDYVKKALKNKEWIKKLNLNPKNFVKKIDEILKLKS
jgi:glycosyltransferase involved in cell wall biosynthesis